MARYICICFIFSITSILLLGGNSFAAEEKPTHFMLSTGGIGYSFPFKSEITSSSDGLNGSKINFIDDLNMDSWFWIPDFYFPFEFKERHRIAIYYSAVRYSGYTNIGDAFNFKGNTYTAGIDASSKFSQENMEAYYSYKIYKTKNIDYWLTGGVGFIENKVKLDTQAFGKETAVVQVIYPVIGVDITYHINDRLDIGLDVTNGLLFGNSNKIMLFEGSLAASYDILKWLTFTGGYSLDLLEARRFKNKISFYNHGPFCVVDVKF